MGRRAVESETPACDDNNNDTEARMQVSTAQVNTASANGSSAGRILTGECQVLIRQDRHSRHVDRSLCAANPSTSVRGRDKQSRLAGFATCTKILATFLAFVCLIAPLAGGKYLHSSLKTIYELIYIIMTVNL